MKTKMKVKMKSWRELAFFYFLTVFFLSCQSKENICNINYSFFVAGHTYGAPGVDNIGLHPPFSAKYEWIKKQKNIAFGVLTGDIVLSSTEKNWDEVDAELNTLDFPVYFAAGNHDLTNRELFEKRYGQTFFSFEKENGLFVFLDPNIDGWNISGEQLVFLKNKISENKSKNIFLFLHQLIWWSPDNIFGKIKPNSTQGRAGSVNYWTEIEPLLRGSNSPIYLFAGDVGAFPNGSEIAFYVENNMTYIMSGMGGGERDNFMMVNVLKNGEVELQLVALNGGDINVLGELKDHILIE